MRRILYATLALYLGIGPMFGQASPRPMTVEDLLALSELGEVCASPDGAWLAATMTRPGAPNACPTCDYKATGDVWLVDLGTGERRNLTNGAADGSSSWLPTWSPDGQRLAFVSTRPEGDEPPGGDNIRLHVWDAATGSISRLADQGVHLSIDIRVREGARVPIAWLDDTRLLAAFLPAGVAADEQMLYWRRAVSEAQRAWALGADGTMPTASILESGGPAPAPLPTVTLQRIDVARRTADDLAELPKWDLWDLTLRMQVAVAPDLAHAAAFVVSGTVPLRADQPLTGELRTWRAGVIHLKDTAPVRWVGPEQGYVGAELLDWSADGLRFAIGNAGDPEDPAAAHGLLVVSALDGNVRDVTPPGLVASSAVWTSGGDLLVRARGITSGAGRWDWWRIGATGTPVNVTASMDVAPSRLLPTHEPERFVGLAGDAVWSVDAGRDAPLRMTDAEFPGGSLRVLPPRPGDEPSTHLLVQSRAKDGSTLTHVVLTDPGRAASATVRRLALPGGGAEFREGDPRTGPLIFSEQAPSGLFVWATDGAGEHALRALALNEQVAGIAEGRRVLVPYRSADGEELQGLVILPPGYEEGKRYPVATWVYGGLVLRDTRTPLASKHSTRPLNLELLAGHGYVVLLPSIPLAPFGVKSDPWLDIPKAVLPCVDKLVELGIADPDRLAVLGHSTGGYSTYAVVTYTDRFKAAIALSGHPDLISLHGQLYPGERMNARAHEGLATTEFVEWGPMNMGGPPTGDLWHYLRNSPLFYLDRVRTPLMIVHGDMDGAPIQQGEEAFNELHRLGRRARFIRYWGEGHVVSSPANVRHLWAEMFDWLDTHLGGTAPRDDG